MAWSASRSSRGRGSLLGVAFVFGVAFVLCAVSLGSTATLASPLNELNRKRLENTVRFLQEAQNSDGGFGAEAGEPSSQLYSAWVALALAAASINPQDQVKEGGSSVYAYLSEHAARAIRSELCAPDICTTALERELLVVDASGTSPEDFGGINLVSGLLERKLSDGSFAFVPGGHGEVNDTIFAILSLSPIKQPTAQKAVKVAAEWVIQQQNTDGSWAWKNKGSPGESDMTGAAIEALSAAGMPNTEAQQKAIEYLREVQEPNGGFPELPSEGESNSGSTAWATQGIWAAGENPETWTKGSGREPLDYLESMQQPDGHLRYRESEELNGVWMTAYAGPAFAGQPLPIEPPPRSPKPSTPPSSPGQSGEGTQSGSGVIAGGGGHGAPLFSRPQPNSKGHKPGGTRQLEDQHERETRYRRNPGPTRKTPVPTAASASASARHPRKPSQTSHRGVGRVRIVDTSNGKGVQSSFGREVKGIPIGAPADALEPGAPGLHSAAASQSSWLAIGIVGALLLCVLAGMQIERRRPQVIL